MISSPELAASASRARGPESKPSPSAKSNPSLAPSSENTGPMSRSSRTYASLTLPGFEESTSSAADSPARTLAPPGRVPESKERVPVSGAKWRGSSPECFRRGSSLRTFLLSALVGLTGYSMIWKRSVTTHGRLWWVLATSARHTGEIASGSLLEYPTPSATPYGTNRGGAA